MTRAQLTEKILDIKREKDWSWKYICEEIGDVFFILTMLTAMFAEQDRFTAEAALERIVAKMIRRHPHVFSGAAGGDEHHLRRQWERIKAEEKQAAATKRPA